MAFGTLLFLGFCFGIGFGFFAQRSGLCFAHGMAEIFIGRGKRFLKLALTIFALTAIGFLASGYWSQALGLKPVGELRGFGFYNLIAGICFGAGVFINGGCIIGTLRQIGEGSLVHIVSVLGFIPGMALVVYGLNPLLDPFYKTQKVLLPQIVGIPAPYVTGALVAVSALLLLRVAAKRN